MTLMRVFAIIWALSVGAALAVPIMLAAAHAATPTSQKPAKPQKRTKPAASAQPAQTPAPRERMAGEGAPNY